MDLVVHKLCDELVSLKYNLPYDPEKMTFLKKLSVMNFDTKIVDPVKCVNSVLSRVEMLAKLDFLCKSNFPQEEGFTERSSTFCLEVPKYISIQLDVIDSISNFLSALPEPHFPLSKDHLSIITLVFLLPSSRQIRCILLASIVTSNVCLTGQITAIDVFSRNCSIFQRP